MWHLPVAKPLLRLEPSNNEQLQANAKIRKAFLDLSGRISLEYSSGKGGMSLDESFQMTTVERSRELLHREGHKWQILGGDTSNAEGRPNYLPQKQKEQTGTTSAVRLRLYSTGFPWKLK